MDAVYKSGNQTRDDIPSHLIVGEDVSPEVAEMYVHMCPAGVYERDGNTLVVNAPNCVDCKATDVIGPRWTPREGGSGAHGFDRDDRKKKVRPRTAVFLLHPGAEKATVTGFSPNLSRDDSLLLPSLVIGDHLAGEELVEGLSTHLMFFAEESSFHGRSPLMSMDCCSFFGG